MRRIRVIDSHTGGEPTRIIVDGGPALGRGTLSERRDRFRSSFDDVRSAVILEPRGSDVLVGGLLCEPVDSSCAAGVIFFNNAGYLNMCGHGMIGLAVTLAWTGQLTPGESRIETPAGVVAVHLLDTHRVAVRNVPSYRYRANVTVSVPDFGDVTGDIAWGGNWFFLVADHRQELHLSRTRELTEFTLRLRTALENSGITGADGAAIDHIELFAEPSDAAVADSRNFVLCPGGAYDRSPCGTGTSAKLACLAADGKITPGQTWRQESILGSVFEGSIEASSQKNGDHSTVIPTITGSAWVTAESTLVLDPGDPFAAGIH